MNKPRYNDEQIIAAILEAGTIKGAADSLNIKPATIYAREKSTEFRDKLNQEKRELVKAASTKIQQGLLEAIDTLRSILKDTTTPTQTRVNCADSIIRNSIKLLEASNSIDEKEHPIDHIF